MRPSLRSLNNGNHRETCLIHLRPTVVGEQQFRCCLPAVKPHHRGEACQFSPSFSGVYILTQTIIPLLQRSRNPRVVWAAKRTRPHKQQHLSVPCGLHNATSVHKWSGRCLTTLSLSSPRLLDHCVLRRHARPEAQNGWPAVGEGTLWRPHGLRSEQGGKPIFVVSQVFVWHYESKWTNAAWHFCRGLKKAWYKWTCPMACDILHQGSLAPTFVHLILTSS